MSLKNIKGHAKPINILKGYLESETLCGGYLFTGEEGIGKFLTARNFAKAVNCLGNEKTMPAIIVRRA
jgi:DNA polymerase-3 subunit delta'